MEVSDFQIFGGEKSLSKLNNFTEKFLTSFVIKARYVTIFLTRQKKHVDKSSSSVHVHAHIHTEPFVT